ncbi:MAG TPA: hypothetical protein VD813_00995, partial [Pseudonocardia sp.]|nr:hypothetical protein [Pseudonocardia sp.]
MIPLVLLGAALVGALILLERRKLARRAPDEPAGRQGTDRETADAAGTADIPDSAAATQQIRHVAGGDDDATRPIPVVPPGPPVPAPPHQRTR